ncbi:MAG TPA: calcium/proton exchanger [Candidatus Limnocylindrales bacterium]|nr:calcium/proton exchanger [Candidatus Limnocylindrales bacterium]
MPLADFARTFGRNASILLAVAVAATIATFVARVAGGAEILVFVLSAVALAGLAGLVGEGTDQVGARFGPGATGVLQSALGNLPELFISIFALQAGLVTVVQTALVGSILANSLLVLGLAFVLGGLRNGVQRFEAEPVRLIAIMLVLAVGALLLPTLATQPGAPDAGHQIDLSEEVSVVLLVVFAASIPYSIRGGPGASAIGSHVEAADLWSLPLAVGVLAGAGAGAALVSDWFVEALRPAMAGLGLSEEFVGLVIVAIAGNAVENVVGVQMAIRNRMDLAISLILNSSLQVALALTPALVLISLVIGSSSLTLVLPPLLLAALALAAILGALIVFDGEATWLEGVALIGLYLIVAASVWYGRPVQV